MTRVWLTWMWTRNPRFCADKSVSPPAAARFPRKLPIALLWATIAVDDLVRRRDRRRRHCTTTASTRGASASSRATTSKSPAWRTSPRPQIMEVMGADIGRNIFFVPLTQQKAQLEQIPWVESASVMRFVPNRLKVEIHERTPVAFARVGPRIDLDRCRRHADGVAAEAQIFVPCDSGNESRRAALDARCRA